MAELIPTPERSTRQQIEYLIANPPRGSVILTFTPEDAAWVLDTLNKGNRGKRAVKIRRFADAMKTGWGLTGDTMKFSNRGQLVDGQNRLHACILADCPFTSHVVFGIEHGLFAVMDRGTNRNGTDILTIAGYSHAGVLYPALRWIKLIETGEAKRRTTFEPEQILQFAKEYAHVADWVTPARKVPQSPTGLTTAILYLASRFNAPKARDFALLWEDGGRAKGGKPIEHMNRRLAYISKVSEGRINDVVRAALAVMAWNWFVQGKAGSFTEMSWSLQDEFPAISGSRG